MVVLTDVQARVAGSLIEKETTTPEYYPLSLNALVNACNQKSSRDPVLELTEREVRGALSAMEDGGLIRVLADARVSKFEHRLREGLGEPYLRRDEVAVICLLLLRGPQTPAELRARAERLYSFDDSLAVQTTLERLAARSEPVTRVMPRQPGAREARWQHLLSGEPEGGAVPLTDGGRGAEAIAVGGTGLGGTLGERVAALEEQVRVLQEQFAQMQGR